MTLQSIHAIAAGLLAATVGCDANNDGEGTLRVTIYGEEFIEDQIPTDAFVDGWALKFDKFLVAVHDVQADDTSLDGTFVFDLTQASNGTGHELGTMPMPAGTVEHLAYRIGPASAGADGNATDQDIAAMAAAGLGMQVVGTATKAGISIAFDWGITADTRYVQCETEQPLADGGEATSQITVHADHLLYDDLDSMTPNVAFDLVATADTDADGIVTAAELATVDIRGLDRYQVGSLDVADLWAFIGVQSTTVGHIDGEGHCETER